MEETWVGSELGILTVSYIEYRPVFGAFLRVWVEVGASSAPASQSDCATSSQGCGEF